MDREPAAPQEKGSPQEALAAWRTMMDRVEQNRRIAKQGDGSLRSVEGIDAEAGARRRFIRFCRELGIGNRFITQWWLGIPQPRVVAAMDEMERYLSYRSDGKEDLGWRQLSREHQRRLTFHVFARMLEQGK